MNKKFKLGLIPHHVHYNLVSSKTYNSDILVIDLTDNIESVIDQILLCNYTISSSLHGIIVSHAYNIPSLWVNFGGIALAGDNVKFADYFSSVNIKEYDPFKLDIDNVQIDVILNWFDLHKEISNLNININTVQESLLNCAPFPVQEYYKL